MPPRRVLARVIAELARQPVLVDFWAPWCEPCKALAPLLEKIVMTAGGKVKLVRMNIDDHPEIPGRLGVRSIAAVIAFQTRSAGRRFHGRLAGKRCQELRRAACRPARRRCRSPGQSRGLARRRRRRGSGGTLRRDYGRKPRRHRRRGRIGEAAYRRRRTRSARTVLASIAANGERDNAIVAARAALDLAGQAAVVGDASELMEKSRPNPPTIRPVSISPSSSMPRTGARRRPPSSLKSSLATGPGTTMARVSNCCNFSMPGELSIPRRLGRGENSPRCFFLEGRGNSRPCSLHCRFAKPLAGTTGIEPA